MSALERLLTLLQDRTPVPHAPLDEATIDALDRELDGQMRPELRTLYSTFGPGTRTAFSPVIHRGVLNAWPIWPVAESLARLRRSDDPLWQLTPALDIWLDTGEVTVLHEDDTEQSFAHFDDYWDARVEEVEASVLDPTSGLWLPPALQPRAVAVDPVFAELVVADLLAGEEVLLPGLGVARPTPPPTSRSTFDHNVAAPGPSLEVRGLDQLGPLDLTGHEALAERWSRDPEWVGHQLRQLHEAVDRGLDDGPVDLCGLFVLIGKHHAARMLPSPGEPIEAPAYREVTARATRALAHRLARP